MMKVLVVKLASLGDVLASSGVFSCLSKLGYQVDHLVDENCKGMTQNNPYINEIISLGDTSKSNIFYKSIQAFKVILQLRKNKYDIAFNFHVSPLISLILYLVGIKNIYGFKNKLSFLYKESLKYDYKNINRTVQEFEILRLFDKNIVNPISLEYYPKINENTLDKFNLPKKYIVCNPGGALNNHSEMVNRRWNIEYYNEVIDNLPYPVVIVGKGKTDKILVQQITSKNSINLVDRTTFDETALILKNSLMYFGNDSSILFLAASLKIATLGIFGPTSAKSANPLSNKQFFIQSTFHCSPCYMPFDGIKGKAYQCSNNECMKSIQPEEVLFKINQILGSL